MMKPHVIEQISRAPLEVGVYVFKNAKGQILYVGKALRLQNRLKSYIHPETDTRPSIVRMVPLIDSVEWLLSENEKEALILENNLIKTHRPKFNIMYRDDKSYLSLKLTAHPFPRLFKTRTIVQDGSTYFGPFSSVSSVNQTLRLLQKMFLIRDCTDSYFSNRARPCLRYQIKRCSAPCVNFIGKEDYLEQVLQVKRFMKGQHLEIIEDLRQKMKLASDQLHYEQAATLRDQIASMEEILKPQFAQVHSNHQAMDVIGLIGDEQAVLIKRVKIRNGKMVSADDFFFEESHVFQKEVLRSFLQQLYLEDISQALIPPKILVPLDFEDRKSFQELFSVKAKHKVNIDIPQRGQKKKYLELANKNAQTMFLEKKRKSQKTHQTLEALQNLLKLPQLPKRIEGYDISNFQGAQSYGSQVVFTDGEKDIGQYRIFKIQTVKGPDDFASLKEVLMRRLSKVKDANEVDLLLIDGGRGQLSQAVEVLRSLNLNVPVVSIAKEKTIKTRSKIKYAPERLYLPNQKNAIVLPIQSPVLQLIQRIRDEAHRFGLKHHRNLRGKTLLNSILKNIPTIGSKRQKELLKYFGSLEKIQQASIEDFCQVPSIGKPQAQNIYDYFRSMQMSEE